MREYFTFNDMEYYIDFDNEIICWVNNYPICAFTIYNKDDILITTPDRRREIQINPGLKNMFFQMWGKHCAKKFLE